jgi:protease PrsW
VVSVFTMEVLRETGNTIFIPAAIFLSASVVPISSVVYLYQHIQNRNISIPLLLGCFFIGGPLGFVASGLFEYKAQQISTLPSLIGISFIEESVKLLFPIIIFIIWRYRHEIDGLLFGVSSGMGFAALETMGYALSSFTQSNGTLESMQWVLLYRSILSPAAHAAWTGIICAILWRYRERTGRWIGLSTIVAYFLAITLHTIWNVIAHDYVNTSTNGPTPLKLATLAVEFLAVIVVGLGLVLWRFHVSRNAPIENSGETNLRSIW